MNNMDLERGLPVSGAVRGAANRIAVSSLKEFARDYLGETYESSANLINKSSWPELPCLPSLKAPEMIPPVRNGVVSFADKFDNIDVIKAREHFANNCNARFDMEWSIGASWNKADASLLHKEDVSRVQAKKKFLFNSMFNYSEGCVNCDKEKKDSEDEESYEEEPQPFNREEGVTHDRRQPERKKKEEPCSANEVSFPSANAQLHKPHPLTRNFHLQNYADSDGPFPVVPSNGEPQGPSAAVLKTPFLLKDKPLDTLDNVGALNKSLPLLKQQLRESTHWFAYRTLSLSASTLPPVISNASPHQVAPFTSASYLLTTAQGSVIQLGGVLSSCLGFHKNRAVHAPTTLRLREFVPFDDHVTKREVSNSRDQYTIDSIKAGLQLKHASGTLHNVRIAGVYVLPTPPWIKSTLSTAATTLSVNAINSLFKNAIAPPVTLPNQHLAPASYLSIYDRTLQSSNNSLFYQTFDGRILIPSAPSPGSPLIDPFVHHPMPITASISATPGGMWFAGVDGTVWVARTPKLVALPGHSQVMTASFESAMFPSPPCPLIGVGTPENAAESVHQVLRSAAGSAQKTNKTAIRQGRRLFVGEACYDGDMESTNHAAETVDSYKKIKGRKYALVVPKSDWCRIMPSKYSPRVNTGGFFLMDVSWFTFAKHTTFFLCSLLFSTLFKNTIGVLALNVFWRNSIVQQVILPSLPNVLTLCIQVTEEFITYLYAFFFTNRFVDPLLKFTLHSIHPTLVSSSPITASASQVAATMMGDAQNLASVWSISSIFESVMILFSLLVSSVSSFINMLPTICSIVVFSQGSIQATMIRSCVFAFFGFLFLVYMRVYSRVLDLRGLLTPTTGVSFMVFVNLFSDLFFFIEAGMYEWMFYPNVTFLMQVKCESWMGVSRHITAEVEEEEDEEENRKMTTHEFVRDGIVDGKLKVA
eukprot:GDKJ01014093.1.p1 GENE.GDKJ01014093.1~~GDKJ01014093.1.p1  ORF type:complete len:985 (-),score=238.96 GDKJ01014093.1:134-2923(-)